MATPLKIGIIGFGSIGAKHLINVIWVLTQQQRDFQIDLIRSGKGQDIEERYLSLIHSIYTSYDSVPCDYDVLFICNPTNKHYETIKMFIDKTHHMFIEKPVFDQIGVDLTALNLKKDAIYYVACPLRYTKVIQYIKNNLDLTQVICARAISSSYLPNWRTNIDYRQTYSAHLNQGGGVSIDLIHEWDYLKYLFGEPQEVLNLRGQFSALEIDSDDLSLYIAKYPTMMVELHLDYFGRETLRELVLFTSHDTIVADLAKSQIRFLKKGEVISFDEVRDDFQRREIEHFFDIVDQRCVNDNTIENALLTLRIVQTNHSL
ncbi:MAG: dehydrogenase [Erysipelotrichaceae bacterium]|nr:MAG: hypothetical protein FD179_962 [Erysipelotrichaceae bacterium]TXT18465.1 MAG: dehydrogenase [Erysipelotrichaceae bacterium]